MWFLMRKTEFTSRNYMYKHIRIIVYIKEKNIKLTENIVNVSCITCKAYVSQCFYAPEGFNEIRGCRFSNIDTVMM